MPAMTKGSARTSIGPKIHGKQCIEYKKENELDKQRNTLQSYRSYLSYF